MPDPSRRTAVFVALAFGLGAAVIARASYVRDPGLRVPPAIGYVVAATLAVAALAVLAKVRGSPRAQTGLAALVLAGMAVTAAWISTPAGARGCRSSLGALPGLPPSFGCRAAFGAGALVTALMAAYALRQWWWLGSAAGRRRRRRPPDTTTTGG
jgi:hypothetical protein